MTEPRGVEAVQSCFVADERLQPEVDWGECKEDDGTSIMHLQQVIFL